MNAAVVIVTKDRREDLERALHSAVAQIGVDEVIVVDDGSTDGTDELVAERFPGVRVLRHEEPCGYIVRRNEGARLTTADVIVSIDDDAEFAEPDTVARMLPLFDDARIGAVALPHVDLLQGLDVVQQQPPSSDGVYVTNCFRGTAYAVRRELFLRLGGFRESLFHQAEEQDLCLRLLAAGSLVAMVDVPPIVHHNSTRRDPLRAWTYGPRNDILFAWHNVPMPFLVESLAKVTAYQLWLGLRVRRPLVFARSLLAGYGRALGGSPRRPVPRGVFRLYRALERRAPQKIDDVAGSIKSHG
jgi:GT2 family glycosyltransferase